MSVASVLQAKGGPFQDDEVTAIPASHLRNALVVGQLSHALVVPLSTQKLFGFASDRLSFERPHPNNTSISSHASPLLRVLSAVEHAVRVGCDAAVLLAH